MAREAHIKYGSMGVAVYYVTFLVLVGYILMSVVIAVMLEKFMLANSQVCMCVCERERARERE